MNKVMAVSSKNIFLDTFNSTRNLKKSTAWYIIQGMKSIERGKSGNTLVTSTDGDKSTIRAKNERIERKKSALIRAKAFLANNPEQVSRFLGGDVDDGLNLSQNSDFLPMVEAIKEARVGKGKFLHDISLLIENSPSSPEESVGKLRAIKFTDYVYAEAERLDIEAQVRRRAMLFAQK